jgi:hypothetical protein
VFILFSASEISTWIGLLNVSVTSRILHFGLHFRRHSALSPRSINNRTQHFRKIAHFATLLMLGALFKPSPGDMLAEFVPRATLWR